MKSIAIVLVLASASFTSMAPINCSENRADQVGTSVNTPSPESRAEEAPVRVIEYPSLDCTMVVADASGKEERVRVHLSACFGERVFAFDPAQRLARGFYTIISTYGDQRFVNKQLAIYNRLPEDTVQMHTVVAEDSSALVASQTQVGF